MKQLPHLVAAGDDVGKRGVLSKLFLQPAVFGRKRQLLTSLLEHRHQNAHVDRFLDEAEGARLHRFDGLGNAAVTRHHDDLRFGTGLPEMTQQVQALRVGQHHVHQDQLWTPRRQRVPSLLARPGRSDEIPARFDQQLQETRRNHGRLR